MRPDVIDGDASRERVTSVLQRDEIVSKQADPDGGESSSREPAGGAADGPETVVAVVVNLLSVATYVWLATREKSQPVSGD